MTKNKVRKMPEKAIMNSAVGRKKNCVRREKKEENAAQQDSIRDVGDMYFFL